MKFLWKIIILGILVFPFYVLQAKKGCCPHEGGASDCDSRTGEVMCQDKNSPDPCSCH